MKKKYDVVVATEKYTNSQGEEKTKWQNIGAVMQNEKGFFMFLDRTFNPAGVANPDNKSNVILSFFEPKQQSSSSQTNQPQGRAQESIEQIGSDIPF